MSGLAFAGANADWTICIDFGTANSKAAAAPRGGAAPTQVRPLPIARDAANPFLMPGAVFIESGRVLLGARALARASEVGPANREPLQSFKTLLGAPDLQRSIAALAPKRVDPARLFRQRDLIVMFLAYLMRGVDRAVAADPVLRRAAPDGFAFRYARPNWRSDDAASAHRTITRLFDEARVVARELAEDLDAHEAPIDVAMKALEKAAAESMHSSWIEGAIFEAAAAATCHLSGVKANSHAMIVLDVGAGTTDIGAMAFDGPSAWEIKEARRTIDLAGDAIDRVLMNLLIEKARHLKRETARASVWRELMLEIRDGKETLFSAGRAAFRCGGKVVSLAARDVLKDPDAAEIVETIRAAYEEGLLAAVQNVEASGGDALLAVAAGGGARLGLVQSILRNAKAPKRAGRPRLRLERAPVTPAWAEQDAYGGALASAFPMLAIAIGGALAPPDLLTM